MTRTGKLISLCLFVLMIFSQANAKVSLQLNVNPGTLEVGDSFTVALEVRSSEAVSTERPTPPTIKGAQLRNQWVSQRVNSSTVTNAQGQLEFQTVQTQIYNYQFLADKDGTLKIPPISVMVGGKKEMSPGGRVKVFVRGAGGSRIPKAPKGRPQPFDDDPFGSDPFQQFSQMQKKFNQLLKRRYDQSGGFKAIPPGSEKDAFFIVAQVDKTEVYKGEQLNATWFLYTKSGVREIDTLKYPDLQGFWKEDIELATLLNFKRDSLNGEPYNKALLASYALFPIEAGKALIDPYKAKVGIVRGFGKLLRSTKSSKEIPILVKPLPTVGRPENFADAVGQYQMSAEVEPGAAYLTNQPFVLRVRIEGNGNGKQFELPKLPLPDTVEIYDVKKESKFFKNGSSYKQFDIYLVPREVGILKIPSIKASYFDPSLESYVEIGTNELSLQILKGAGQTGLKANRIGKTQRSDDKLALISHWEPESFNPRPNLFLWLSLFAISFLCLLAYSAYRLNWLVKAVGLKENIQLRLQKVHKLKAQKKWRGVGIEVTNLIYYVLGEISGQGGADVEFDKLIVKCPPSIRREVGADLRKCADQFYLLGFGPDKAIQSVVQNDGVTAPLKKVEELLDKVIKMSQAEEH